jgi:SPP1 gp7 family putative phage head morphogenesis protein
MPERSLITIATRHQSHYERLKSAEVKKFDSFLLQMEKGIRNKLTSADITNFTRSRMERQLVQIGTLMNRSFKEYKKVWRDSVLSAAEYEAGFEIRSLGQVVSGVNFSMPSDSQITAAVFNTPLGDIGGAGGGSLLEPWLDNMTVTEIKRVQGAIRMGYAQGETTADIVRRIRGTKAAGYSDGILAITKRNAETVARTALQHAAQQARGEVWKKNDSVIKRVKWISTLDSTTSITCRSLDGQEYSLDKGPRPPAHPDCRSSTVAVLDDKYKDLSRGRTRSERDPDTGKVGHASADQTYYGWLKTQPADVQNSIIGPTRGKLLRNGGISSQRFAELQLGKLNNPLTLKEMRELDPVAFTKAGL